MGRDPVSPANHYLTHYGAAEATLAGKLNWPQQFNHVVVVPAYAEAPAFLHQLQQHCRSEKALIILVVNQPQTIQRCDDNERLWQFLCNQATLLQERDNLFLFNRHDGIILAVDRFRGDRALPPRQGVGLARKIGCDIAAGLIQQSIVASPWIHSTDADTALPDDYFRRPAECDGSAAVYPFIHSGDSADPVTAATQLYEQSLYYYVDGLRWAGSPYAFHAIGSCLALNAIDYCRVRGFPKRAGGEDFYLLNKLAKLGAVIPLAGEPIRIVARRSRRTPFGTGPAVEKILALKNLESFQSYDPRVFVELKDLLLTLSNWWQVKDREAQWLAGLSEAGLSACQQLGIDDLFRHLRKQARGQAMALQTIHDWFDGFRTLKFIHLLQNSQYKPIKFQEALAQATTLFGSTLKEEVSS